MRPLLLTTSVLFLLIFSSCTDPYVTPADTSAGALDVKVSVIDMLDSSSGGNLVVMQFFSGGKPVRFAAGETVSCNGVAMPLNDLIGYSARVPIAPVGGSYNFVYTQSGVPTSINLVVPPRVVFTSPTNGATVARSSAMTITYVADGGSGINPSAGWPGAGMNLNIFQPDNGTYTGFNTTSFGTGPGTLSLQRRFEGAISGTGFHSATKQYDSWSAINVTWN